MAIDDDRFYDKIDLDVASSYCPGCAQKAMADLKATAAPLKQSAPDNTTET